MITPDEILAKAQRLYPQVVDAWLDGREIFPYAVRANLKPSPAISDAIREHEALRERSKEKIGYGYSLDFERRNSRRHGAQNFASSVYFQSREDLLKWIGKTQEFCRLARSVELLRSRQPQLDEWARRHWRELLAVEGALSQLLDVAEYLKAHPRPNCFVRELPLAISTKLVEEHRRLLGQWLDILAPQAVDVTYGYDQFALRYGFRTPEDQLLFRILDPNMLAELQCPGTELALPLGTLAELPVRDARVIIVENKINLLTLPPMPRTLALGGLGNGVSRLFPIPWIEAAPLLYWGDIDIEGFGILARVRSRWPQTRSVMMDTSTLEEHRELIILGNECSPEQAPPAELTAIEQAAFIACRDKRLRLEQERIPQDRANSRLPTSLPEAEQYTSLLPLAPLRGEGAGV